MNKKYKCLNLDDYILPGYEEITGDALYRINGGGRIENSNEAVAGAEVGDTLIRDDGTEVTITQGDIDWAKDHLGGGNGTSQATPEPVGTTPAAELTPTVNPTNSSVDTSTNPGKIDYPSSTAGYGNLGNAVIVPYMDGVNESNETIFFDPHNESRIFCEIDGNDIRVDKKTLYKLEGMLSEPGNNLWGTVRNRRTGMTNNLYSLQEVSAYIVETENKFDYDMMNAPKKGGKWVSRTVTAGGEKVQLIYFREDIEYDYQAKKALDNSAYVLREGQVINGFTFYSNNGDAYLLDSNGNKVSTTKPLQGKNVDIFPGSPTKSGVDPDTLYKNYMGTCYTGPHNPKNYKIEDGVKPKSNYDYLPRNLSEFASMIHDIRYEEKKASGVKGALFNTKVLYADFELVRNNYYNFNVTSDIKDKARSLGTMAAFELIGGGKSYYKFCNDFYNSCNDLYNDFCNDYYNAGSNWKNYSKRTVNKFFQKVNNLFN